MEDKEVGATPNAEKIEIQLVDEQISDDELIKLATERTRLNQITDLQTGVHAAAKSTVTESDSSAVIRIADETPEQILEDLKALRDKKHLYVIKVNGKIAGCIGIADYAPYLSATGRKYWTITRATVETDYRGTHLASKLADFALQQILKEDPQGIIWIITSDPKMKNYCRRLPNVHEVALQDTSNEFARIRLRYRGEGVIRKQAAQGDVYFIFDPQLPSSSGPATA